MWELSISDTKYNKFEFEFDSLTNALSFVDIMSSRVGVDNLKVVFENVEKAGDENED